MTTVFSESWTGSNGAAWPSAWTTESRNTIQSNQGQLSSPAFTGTAAYAALSPTLADCEILLSFTPDTTAVSAATSVTVAARVDAVGTYTSGFPPTTGISVNIVSDGTSALRRTVGGTTTFNVSGIPRSAWVAGTTYMVRFRVVGTQSQMRWWDASGSEPGTWALDNTNASTPTSAGSIRLGWSGSGSTVRLMNFDNLTVDNLVAEVPVSDTGSGSEDVAVAAATSLAQAATGADALAVAAGALLAQTGTVTDAVTLKVTAPLAEASTGTDTLTSTAVDPDVAQQADIDSLKASRTADESAISSLQSSRTTDESDISSLKSSRTTDEASLSEAQSSQTTDESAISSLQSRVTALENGGGSGGADESYHLADYGALGTADDSATWTNAVNSIPAGATLFVPVGTTTLAPGFILPKAITIQGSGWGSCIKVKNSAGNYTTLFSVNATQLSNVTFRNLRFDQNVADTTCDITTANGHIRFVMDLNVTDLTVEGCYFWPYVGVNAIVNSHYVNDAIGNRRTRIVNNVFYFQRGHATTTPYYDTSTLYLKSDENIVQNNYFITDGPSGVYAAGAIEHHGVRAVITGNYSRNFSTLLNYAPSQGRPGDAPSVVANNVVSNGNLGIQLWIIDTTNRGLVIANNMIQIRQTQWRLYNFGGIQAGSGTGELVDFTITGNVIDFEEELTTRTVADPTNGISEQQDYIAGIGLHADNADYTDGLISGNTVRNCPFTGFRMGGTGTTLTRVTVTDNVSINNGHYPSAGSSDNRSHFLWRTTQNYSVARNNTIRESYSPLASRFRHRAGTSTATGCILENTRFVTPAANTSWALSPTSLTTGWTEYKAPVKVTATYDPPSLTAGTATSWQSVTVPGAALGDRSTATFSLVLPTDATGMVRIESQVTAAETVQYRFINGTGSTQDVASGTVTVTVG